MNHNDTLQKHERNERSALTPSLGVNIDPAWYQWVGEARKKTARGRKTAKMQDVNGLCPQIESRSTPPYSQHCLLG
jgi:hypothetical protein